MGQFHFRPERYLELMESEMAGYRRLQDEAAGATGAGAARILELGTGTGETARRVLARHPGAALAGLDASADMLAAARAELPGADLRVARSRTRCPRARSTSSSRHSPSTISTGRARLTCSCGWPACCRPAGGSCSAT